MGRLRGRKYLEERYKFVWFVRGVRWEYTTRPMPNLYRNSWRLTSYILSVPILCLDDAMVFSVGWEEGWVGRVQD